MKEDHLYSWWEIIVSSWESAKETFIGMRNFNNELRQTWAIQMLCAEKGHVWNSEFRTGKTLWTCEKCLLFEWGDKPEDDYFYWHRYPRNYLK